MAWNPYNVQVGQVWRDNDPRVEGRAVRVDEVGETHATVTVVEHFNPWSVGKVTRIRLDRFQPISTGYRLDTELPA